MLFDIDENDTSIKIRKIVDSVLKSKSGYSENVRSNAGVRHKDGDVIEIGNKNTQFIIKKLTAHTS